MNAVARRISLTSIALCERDRNRYNLVVNSDLVSRIAKSNTSTGSFLLSRVSQRVPSSSRDAVRNSLAPFQILRGQINGMNTDM